MKKKTFKREEIPQHKEVLPNGLFVPTYIKKNRKVILNKILTQENEEEIDEYISKYYPS